ncbi:MAG: class I SAM-dependent methyltransferase [Candidatus Paceibacterota bacterium]|jgi:SAM-dependent methyltransferase
MQDEQYVFPYHHLVDLEKFSNYKVMSWGFEYYAYMTAAIDIIKKLNPRSFLDVGCGEGKMILELARSIPSGSMKGIDLSERAILFAQAFNYDNDASFECKDIAELSGSYDAIALVETMEHIPDGDIKGIVDNVKRILSPSGRVIVTVPASNFPVQRKHYRHYDIELIMKQFEGFSLEEVRYLVAEGLLHKILIRLSRKFCSFDFLRKAFFQVAKAFVFEARKDSARHILCVLKRA